MKVLKGVLTAATLLLMLFVVATLWNNTQWSARRRRTTPPAAAVTAGDAARIQRLIRESAGLEEKTGRGSSIVRASFDS